VCFDSLRHGAPFHGLVSIGGTGEGNALAGTVYLSPAGGWRTRPLQEAPADEPAPKAGSPGLGPHSLHSTALVALVARVHECNPL